jgi:hypothetical protein
MRNIEGPYRHMSSVTSGPELANVFDSQWIEGEDVRALTAAAGDVITMDNSEGNSHTTLIVAVRQDSRQMFTIGGNEGGTVGGPTARDYFDPTVWGRLRGIGKIQPSWFDFESGYLPGCRGAAPAFKLSPRDFRGGREEALVGRNTFCGTLMARGEDLEGNCQTSTVSVVHDGTVKATLALRALESVALTQVGAGPNRVELQARCGAQSRSEIYHRDTRAPSFRELRVYMSGTRIAIEPVGLSDDGYWLTSDYDLRVILDGGSERSHRGSVALLQGLAAGAHTARVRVGDGCDRLSASQTVTFSVNGSGQLLDPAAGTGSGPCPVGQQRNALGRCVAASCDGERGWIFDPTAAAGNGGCVCAPPGHPLYNPTDCIY